MAKDTNTAKPPPANENTQANKPARGKFVKVFRVATGLDAIESIVKNVVVADISTARDIKNMAVKAFEKPQPAIVDSDSSDTATRFQEAMTQYGVSEEDLVSKVKYSGIMCNVAILCTALIIASMIAAFPFVTGKIRLFEFMLMGIMVTLLFLGLTVKWGFWNYQLRERNLYKIQDYLKNPAAWLPKTTSDAGPPSGKGPGGVSRSRRATLAVVSLVAAMSFGISGGAARADTGCTGTNGAASGSYVSETFSLPCQYDLYRNSLETIFPNVGPLGSPAITSGAITGTGSATTTANTNGQAAISEAFMAFITILMTAGSSVLLWHIISIIVAVAHEGTSLQQKWAGFWPWVRMFLGASMLAPYTKGFCLAQVIVLYAALWGGSLGNIIWTAYLNGLTEPKLSSNYVMPYVTGVLHDAEVADVCYNLIKRQVAIGNSIGIASTYSLPSSDPSVPTYSKTTSTTQASYVDKVNKLFGQTSSISYGSMSTAVWDFGGSCGHVSLDIVRDQSNFSTYDDAKVTAISKFISTMDAKNSALIEKAISNENGTIPQDMPSEIVTLYSQYQAAESEVYSSISSAAYTFLNSANSGYLSKFKDNAAKYGWVESGSFYMNISRMQSLIDNFLSIAPSTSTADYVTSADIRSKTAIQRILSSDPASSNLMTMVINKMSMPSTDTQTASATRTEINSSATAGNFNGMNINTNLIGIANPDSTYGEIISWCENTVGGLIWDFISKLTGLDDGKGETNNGFIGSELQNMTEFGQNLLSIGGHLIGIFALGWLVSSLTSWMATKTTPTGWLAKKAIDFTGGSVVSKFMSAGGGMIAKMVMWAITTLLVVGAIHAYVLPMMPYIQFILFFMSMLIIVVEAMIAAPIWAFMHLRLDGNELIGQQQQIGYQLVFNLFLRVPLAMLGMLLSISVFNATVLILSITFYPAMTAATGDGGAGIIGSLVMLLIMSYLHYQVAIRSFSLISAVPSRVSKWFGAGMTDEAEHTLMGNIGGFIAGQATQTVRSSMANAFTPKRKEEEGGAGGKAKTPNNAGAVRGGAGGGGADAATVSAATQNAGGVAGGAITDSGTTDKPGGDAPSTSSKAGAQMPGGTFQAASKTVAADPQNKGDYQTIGGQANFQKLMGALDHHIQENGGGLTENDANRISSQFVDSLGSENKSEATQKSATKLIQAAFKQYKELS